MRDPENPWTTKSVATAYENPWIRVEHHEVDKPSGAPGIYGVVRFRNVGVGVIPMDDEGNTWLVGQWRYPLARYSWEIPEGGAPRGESPLAAAQRELQEEVGITAGRWEPLVEMDVSNSVTDERAIVFLARDLRHGPSSPEDTERLAVRKVPFQTLYEEVLAGRHRDSMTVAGVLRLKLMMLEGQLTP